MFSSPAVRSRVVVSYIVVHRHKKSYPVLPRRRLDRFHRARASSCSRPTSTLQPSSSSSRLFHMRRILENTRRSFTKKPAFERLVGFGATPRESVRRLFRLRHLPEAAAPSQSSLGDLFRSPGWTRGPGCGEDASGEDASGEDARRRGDERRGDPENSPEMSSPSLTRSTHSTSGRVAPRGSPSSPAMDSSIRWASEKSPTDSYTLWIWWDKTRAFKFQSVPY